MVVAGKDILIRRIENEARVVFKYTYDKAFVRACEVMKLRGLLTFGPNPIPIEGLDYKAWYADIYRLDEETLADYKMLVNDFYTTDLQSRFYDLFSEVNAEKVQASLHNPSTFMEAQREVVDKLIEKYKNTTSPLEFYGSKHQAEGVALFLRSLNNKWAKGAINADAPGLGKGHPVGTKILTPKGWVPIELLKIGDEVIGKNGRPTTITGVYPRGVLDVFRVTFNDKTSVLVDDDHIWWVGLKERVKRTGLYEQMTTKELRTSGKYLGYIRIPTVEPIQFTKRNLVIKPYTLGVLLGDGSLKKSVEFTSMDPGIVRRVKKELPKGTKMYKYAPDKRSKAVRYSIVGTERKTNGNVARDELKRLGVYGKLAHEKEIPEEYMMSSVEQRLDLLRGLMDTDGYITSDGMHIEFSSSSEKLSDGVIFLVQSLGGITRKKVKKAYCNGEQKKDAYVVTIKLNKNFLPFHLKRKVKRYVAPTKYLPYRVFKKIEAAGKAPVICISVSAEDQLYVTENCIVTHNTRQAVVAAIEARMKNILVVAPKTAKVATWPAEIKMVDPRATIFLADLKHYQSRAQWTIIHWDMLRRLDSDFYANARTFDLLICDEFHRAANADSQRSQAVALLAKEIPYLWGLTGTPVTKRPKNVVNLLTLLKHPIADSKSKIWRFLNRYCGGMDWTGHYNFDGAKNIDELHEHLRDVLIRREADSTNLPEKVREIKKVELTEAQRKVYDHAWEEYCNRPDVKEKQQSATYPFEVVKTGVLRKSISLAKVPHVIEWAEELIEAGEKVVIFTDFTDVFNAYMRHFGSKAVGIHGATEESQRGVFVKKFQEDDSVKVFIGNIKAAGEGITLTAASYLAFNDITWRPVDQLQAENRIYRGGAKKTCFIVFFLGDDTIDEKGFKDFIEHKDVVERIVNRRDENGEIKDAKWTGDTEGLGLEKKRATSLSLKANPNQAFRKFQLKKP